MASSSHIPISFFLYIIMEYYYNLFQFQKYLKMQANGKNQLDFFQFLRSAPSQLNQQMQINLQMRMKFPTEIDKFYPSEQAMNEVLIQFQSKLEQTEESSYHIINQIINSKILIPLLKTLEHPNLDINISSINCFYSLTLEIHQEIEQEEKNQQNNTTKNRQQKQQNNPYTLFFRMVIWFVENNFVQSLFAIISRINEENIEEYEICRKALKMVEFLVEFSDVVYPILVKNTKIVAFLANRIMVNFTVSHRVIDDNKYIVSDLLLALLQTPQIEQGLSAVRQFYQSCGIEVILETLSSYENKLPNQIDQKQYLMNLFHCLNVMLVSVKQCRKQFHTMKGCYLMVSFICKKQYYAVAALKALSNSMNNQHQPTFSAEICTELVNNNSLKYLFPILMRLGIKGKDDEEQEQINEHILRIVYFLVQNSVSVSRERVLWKFMEKRYAKLERVFEIRVENQGNNAKLKQIQISAEEYIQLIKEEGLSLVQLCDKIILTVWGLVPKARAKVTALMGLYSVKSENIRVVVERQYRFIDEGLEKEYMAKLIAFNLRQMEENSSI